MTMDRRWIALALTLFLALAVAACGKKDPATPVPPPDDTEMTAPDTEEVEPQQTPATTTDPVERQRPATLDAWTEDLRNSGLIGDVYFAFDKYDLDAESRERLAKNVEFLRSEEGRGVVMTIEGHCDERGTNEYNLALGQRRATAALDYMTSLGLSRDRLKTISYGEERPFCTESTESCWARNRRAHFVITEAPGY